MARPYKPKGVPGLMPYLTVSNPKRSIEFYTKAFGFEITGEPMMDKGEIMHAEMKYLDAVIMLGPEGPFNDHAKTPRGYGQAPSLGLYVYCEDVDSLYKRAISAGAESLTKPETMFWGDRMCRVVDPDGYRWAFATNVGEHDPTKASA